MIKQIIPFVERLFSLLVVFLMLSATTLWSGQFFGKDWLNTSSGPQEKVSLQVAAPNAREMAQLRLSGKRLVPQDSITWVVKDGQQSLGVVISSLSLAQDVIGYAGNTPLFVYIDTEGTIQGIATMANDETPGFFRRAKRGILGEWKGLTVEEALDTEVDVVTGATYTSRSLNENVRAVLSAYAATDLMRHDAPAIGWGRTLLLFAVFAFGLVVSWRFRGIRWLRLAVMVLNVGITGFWCGQFLSLSILHGWIQNGVDLVLYLPTIVMLVLAIVLPYIGKSHYYCNWMCPYGSLQDLAWQLPLPKVKISAKAYKRMGQLRLWILLILLLMMWMGTGFFLIDYEPFTAFIVSAAAPAVIVLAASFVVLGIFIPHPWCRCVCPVGTLLNLAEEKK